MKTPAEVAHVAGLLDVTGVFRVRVASGTVLPMVAAHSTRNDLLSFLGAQTGTGVTEVKRNHSKFGCSEHCPDKHVHVNHSSLRWSVTGIRAGILIFNVLPFLVLQEEQARKVLDETADAPFKRATAQAMGRLGWALPEGLLDE